MVARTRAGHLSPIGTRDLIEDALERPAVKEDIGLRLGVHDVSRIEWTASVQLPKEGERKYEITFRIEIPANLYPVHEDWDQLQIFSRLQSPAEEGQLIIERADIDELRRDTLGIAHRLKTERDSFERLCTAAAGQLTEALHPSLEQNLATTIGRAVELVATMRSCLYEPMAIVDPVMVQQIEREANLADEFLSYQLMDFFSSCERSLSDVLLGPGSRLLELDVGLADRVSGKVAEGLANEVDYRAHKGFANPSPESPGELGRFVDRGSSLKKHFQGVLFLDADSYRMDNRVNNWTGLFAAMLAASLWLGFTLLPIGPGTRAGIGVGTFAVLFAAAYAAKDRVKEVTRRWLTGRLTRFFGQKVVALRLPLSVSPNRQMLIESRETLDVDQLVQEDALNRSLGRTRRVVVIKFNMRVTLRSSQELRRVNIDSVKHIFRHDLSPIFSRLDNAVKRVPVLDPVTKRVRFADAPKEYTFPVHLEVIHDGKAVGSDALLVVSKRGIERIEMHR